MALLNHPDSAVCARAEKLFSAGSSSRHDVIAEYQSSLTLSADAARGNKIFERECAACHQLGDRGFAVGPNLALTRNRTPGAMLEAILDPNREVQPRYVNYVVVDTDGRTATALINRDVGLAATTIKTANSPLFGLRRPAGTIQDALNYLGARTISEVVTGLLLRQAFPVLQGAAMIRFWEDSSSIAALTARVALSLKAANPGAAYTYGLFRDCGMPVLLCKHAGYAKIMADAAFGNSDTLAAEESRYQTHHAAVGMLLARNWQLPEVLCAAIEHHHDEDALYGGRGDIDPVSMKLIACAARSSRPSRLSSRGPAILAG